MWSDWKSLHLVGSDYYIPEDLVPADAFQLSWFLEWELTPMFEGGFTTHKGQWRWQILTGPGGELSFDSCVSIYGTAIWFPGGELISWYIQENANNPIVNTLVPVRPAMLGTPSDASSWHQRSDGSWDNYAEHGTIVESGWVAGAGGPISVDGDGMFPVYVTYESALYEVQLSAGSTVKVPFHNVGPFLLPKMAGVRIRTLTSGDVSGLFDVPGYMRVGKSTSGKAYQTVSADGGRSVRDVLISGSLRNPQITKGGDNTTFCLGERGGNWLLTRSMNDGITWEGDDLVWPAGYQYARVLILPGGVWVSVALKGTTAFCLRSDSRYQRQVATSVKPPITLQSDDRYGIVMMDMSGKRWCSKDGGNTWEDLDA